MTTETLKLIKFAPAKWRTESFTFWYKENLYENCHFEVIQERIYYCLYIKRHPSMPNKLINSFGLFEMAKDRIIEILKHGYYERPKEPQQMGLI